MAQSYSYIGTRQARRTHMRAASVARKDWRPDCPHAVWPARRSRELRRRADDERPASRDPEPVTSTPHDDAPARVARIGIPKRWRAGGSEGNELLTSATAVVLIALLVAEGLTILDLRPLVDEHMFIGLVLIPPVLLKLGSTGYRFVRYYTRSRAYVGKGPPVLPLRVAAPLLVIATVALFTSGALLLAAGHRTRSLLQIHQVSTIAWAAVFAVHFLAYIPRVARSLGAVLRATRETAVPGAEGRRLLLAGATGAGVALALALLPAITGWHR